MKITMPSRSSVMNVSPESGSSPGSYVLLLFGVWSCATAIIFIKLSSLHPVFIVALRLLLGAAILSPLYFRDLKRNQRAFKLSHLKTCILPGTFLALHFVSWVIGARMTLTAQASLIVNLVPLVMPFFLYVVIKEKLHRAELIATPLALLGLFILGMNDFHISPDHLLGDLICFGSMLFFSYYLVLSRKYRNAGTIFEYVVPLYTLAGVLCLIPCFFIDGAFDGIAEPREIGYVIGLALLPTVAGHTILNYSMKKLRGQVVSIFNGTQFIFAGAMAFVILQEIPSILFYPAALLIITSALIVIRAKSH